jgi:hypothetical protein
MSQYAQIEQLIDELKSLVAWRALPQRLAMKPLLCQMAGVGDDMTLTVAGGVVRRYTVSSINSLSGVYEFQGKQIEAAKLNRVLKLILGFEGPTDVTSRRRRAIFLLGVSIMPDQWRRQHGPERELLAVLAEEMYGRYPQEMSA